MKELIRKLRMALYLNQTEFGKLIGVKRGTVCNYESGHRMPQLRTVKLMVELAREHHIEFNPEEFYKK